MKRYSFLERHWQAAAALLLCASLLLCAAADYAMSCRSVRQNVLRLHVTANSDSPADQRVKLLVRDAILTAGADCFADADSESQAEARLAPALHTMQVAAERVLRENGFAYTASVKLTTEYFATRSYGDVTLPAGNYRALRITLGRGEGKNWWCVMFPPLCLPAAQKSQSDDDAYAVWNGAGAGVVHPENGYEIRFRIIEIAEAVWQKLTARDHP